MTGLPYGWIITSFDEVFDFKGGTQPPKAMFSDIPLAGFVRLLQIRDYESDDKAVYIRDEPRWSKCEQSDLMIGRYGASVGKILTGKSGAYNVALVKLVFEKSCFDAGFVMRYLKSGSFQDPLKNISRSAQNGFITADNQVLTTEASAIQLGAQRAQYEHAIAVLIGRSPSAFSIPKRRWKARKPPAVPAGIPSELLERRPDIAAAERDVQSRNALIGVAIANFYPTVNLSAALSFAATQPWPIAVANEVWSLSGGAAQTLFDGGALDAQRESAMASYRQAVAAYRQTVLAAFSQVEDQLATVRQTTQQVARLDRAVDEAREAVSIYLNQYRVGTVVFTSVANAQSTLLGNIRSAVSARQTLYVATVDLIGALGGGWDASRLPPIEELSAIAAPPSPVPASALAATVTRQY